MCLEGIRVTAEKQNGDYAIVDIRGKENRNILEICSDLHWVYDMLLPSRPKGSIQHDGK